MLQFCFSEPGCNIIGGACSVVAPPNAWCYVAECGFALIALPDECIIARWEGRCPVEALLSMVEPSSWPEWLEHSPCMV
jgi:hypothetical protein